MAIGTCSSISCLQEVESNDSSSDDDSDDLEDNLYEEEVEIEGEERETILVPQENVSFVLAIGTFSLL